MEKNEVTPESITLLENNIAPTNMANSHTQSSRDADSPWIHAKICDSLFTRALLDTCSSGPRLLLTNYISSRVVDNIKLIELKNKTPIISNCTCSRAVTHTQAGTFETATCIHLNLTLFRDDNKVENKRISFRVKNGLSEDMIIGIHTIRELDLSKVFRPLFINPQILQHTDHEHEHEQPPAVEQNIQTPPTSHESEVSVSNSVSHNTRSVTRRAEMLNRSSCTNNLQTTIVSTEAESRPDISLRVAECSEPWRGTNFLNDLNIVDKSIYLDIEEDFDPLDELSPENPAEAFINDSNDGWDIAPEEDRIKYILHNIESPDVRKAMRPVLTSFIKVFRKELPNEPSLLPPFKLELNEHNDWFIDRTNKRPARIQAIVKQQEVRKFIKKALTIGLIRPSQAQSWPQVLLTPKKDTGKWRFCIDFRSLNNASKPLGWPIPNIKHMLTRIGNKKAKYFAVIDLTQGYYQISLDETSKEYTAFRTADGLFEWNRLGMGLKGAGSYFQFHMQNTVLIDLLYDILEAYLDDIITWGLTIEELVSNLTQIFARFEKWNIFVNPDKVKFGLTHVEYVGSVIDQHGMHFSPEKREKVLDFKLPRTAKDMKSFLGLTGQFRDHVEHYGELAAPLHTLCDNYNKKNPTLIEWTEQLQQQFSAFQDAVATCPKLFFMDDISPIYLHTDASNVGIGAYLHQQVDARRVPIQFISKTLTKTERKWDTVEKEAYAIFYAFNKLEAVPASRSNIYPSYRRKESNIH